VALEIYKNILPQFISIRPINLYKKWILRDYDITTKSNLASYISASVVSASYTGSFDSYYKTYYITGSRILPNFPGLNVKYARYYDNETGSLTPPNDYLIETDDYGDYVLSYNYKLLNGDLFYPAYQSSSGWINPDGTYSRIVYYSLKRLFYSNNSLYYNLIEGTASKLNNEAFVFEIPKKFVADSIEPGTFILRDSSDIMRLPYSSGSWSWSVEPRNNTSSFEGIKLIDDGRGNIYDANYVPAQQRGNIFYKLGLIVITDIAYARYFKNYLIDSRSII